MSQNPQERPEPPVFPAVNRPPTAPQNPPASLSAQAERPPMTRREARAAREAEEARLAPQEGTQPQEQQPAAPPAEAPAPVGPASAGPAPTQPEPGEPEPAQPAPPVSAASTPSAGWSLGGEPISSPTPTQESSADRAALAGLDFDAVITGPVAQVEEPQPVGATARHGADDRVASPPDHPARTVFGVLEDTEDETAEDGHPLIWRQQNYLSHDEPPKKRRWVRGLVVTVVILAVLGGLAGGAYAIFQPQIVKLQDALFPPENDYKGSGSGEVMFTIKSGDDGSTIANNLAKAGVVKTYEAFYSLLLRQKSDPEFQPGVFKLAKKMSAASALAALQDPQSRVENTAVIPEGTAEKDILQTVADATKIPLADLQAAAANPQAYGVPAEAKSLEGFLFPATYTFAPGTTAQQAIKTMVDRMFQALDEAGVAPENRWNTIVLASIVQREAGLKDDYPKVARVFLNRIAQGWDLQSDATVAYGTGHTDRVTTTDAEREDANNPYNTYVHPGLPVGPISNPGDLAINAVQHPADGTWMYFVTWNLQTGETIFSTTQAEHEAAVEKWQQWMKDNPGYG
ncbi:endolytic transglycosylase MltG [Leifsonia virtsii]|uniref:Endolytic murein transglycosylase n=1 Tax=Leifsonia virtsii TaxID=3035915 RepID=A0ABT8IT84_9MICO|nr:endolytic transglycosylase MltG [Leifsonia virtsii]MDN4595991.1 endolytic transglycosylase MltG [Leifsonia virtsii]